MKKDKNYIGNDEVNSGQNFSWIEKLSNAIPALQNMNYRYYFTGQLISLTGSWLQVVAQSWLVLKIANSAFLISLVAAFGSLPLLFITPFGGVIVDKFDKKKIILFTQFASMFLAITLGLLTIFDLINIWEICVLSFLSGFVLAIDSPARHAFVPEFVSKEQLASAIALNSGIFNAARVIGPSIAGLLIALTSIGGAFLINGISYIATIIALFAMNVPAITTRTNLDIFNLKSVLLSIKEGFVYVFNHNVINILIIMTAVTSVFGWSYTTILPYIAKNDFNLGAAGLGYLYASAGTGSVVATLIIAAFSRRISARTFIVAGNIIFALSLIAFSYTNNLNLAVILLFFAGFGVICQFAMINTTIQRLVKNELRGRVMSIYVLMFIGLTPIGNFEIGILSENFGTSVAIRVGAIIIFFSGILILFIKKKF